MTSTSVIICTRNRVNDLMKCMDSLTIQTRPIFELIIIDSGDRVLDDVIGKYKNSLSIKYIRCKSSLTAARNIGIKEGRGDLIVFLDDDVVLDREYIYNVTHVFETYGKEVGAVSGNIISDELRSRCFSSLIRYPVVRRSRNFVFKLFFLYGWGDGRFQPSGFPTHPIGKKDVRFIECLQGASMTFRKEVFENMRFDENLIGYCFMEDCDISYRVAQQYKIIYTPYAKLYHNVSPASRDSDHLRMKMLIENHHYLFNKNFPQRLYNRFTFWVSVIGLFFISFLELNKDEIRGLLSGFKTIMHKTLRGLTVPRRGS